MDVGCWHEADVVRRFADGRDIVPLVMSRTQRDFNYEFSAGLMIPNFERRYRLLKQSSHNPHTKAGTFFDIEILWHA